MKTIRSREVKSAYLSGAPFRKNCQPTILSKPNYSCFLTLIKFIHFFTKLMVCTEALKSFSFIIFLELSYPLVSSSKVSSTSSIS